MKIEQFIVGFVLVLIVALPYVLIKLHKQKRKKYMIDLLQAAVAEKQAKISNFEVCGKLAIGIDEDAGLLFLVRVEDDGTHNTYVQDICKVKNAEHIVTYRKRRGEQVVNQILIRFQLKDKQQTFIEWMIYSREEDLELYDELAFTQKWVKSVNDWVAPLQLKPPSKPLKMAS